MKRFFIAAIIAVTASFSALADFEQIFNKCEDIKGVTAVYISKTMLSMSAGSISSGNLKIKDAANSIDNLYIIDVEEPEATKKVRPLIDKYISGANPAFETVMRVKDEDELTRFLYRKISRSKSELWVLDSDHELMSLIVIIGNFKPEDISKMINNR